MTPALSSTVTAPGGPAARSSPSGWVSVLAARGNSVALVDDTGPVTYAGLARLIGDRMTAYPSVSTGRRVIGLVASNSVAFLVDHLAALAAGHVVLLLPGDPVARRALVEAWEPDLLAGAGEEVPSRCHDTAPRHELHPELMMLMSTSGSTGSPKLVRLSRRAVLANARSIVEYLGIVPGDRAITTLPAHYCYGLSVLHTHLLAGASVVLTGHSVNEDAFWERARATGVTTLSGVPHTYEMIERRGVELLDSLPRLRYVTQAGGRLAPESVRRFAGRLRDRGAELVVMYGQTEATARMGYLPPHLAESRPDAVGIAIPGGRFRVDPRPGAGPGEPGELVYTGSNVMMGYAGTPPDLARGHDLTELRTGDLARIADDGLVEIVGRLGREVKVFGIRIDLGRVESGVADRGHRAWCVGRPDRLVLVTESREDGETLRSAAAELSGLAPACVEVLGVDAVPRTASGKVDQKALSSLVARGDDTAATNGGPGSPSAIVAEALGLTVTGTDTFSDLGGDSLTYVVVSTRLEQAVDRLPRDWHHLPLAELDALAATADCGPAGPRGRIFPGTWARMDTGLVLRAVFILTIVATHTRALTIIGGAHVLVALTGYSLARFQLHSPDPRTRAVGVLRTAGRILLPAVLWLALVTPWTSRYHWYSPLLLTNVFGPRSWWDDRWWNPWQMWFVEAVVYALLLLAVVMAIPAVTRADQRWPFLLPGLVVAAGLAVRFGLVDLGGGPRVWYSAPAVAWLFGLGWAIARCRTWRQRVLWSAVILASVPGWFGDPSREAVVAAGLLVLTWVRVVPVPRALVGVLTPLAAASLFIYLTHFLVYPPIRDAGHEWVSAALSVAVGLLAWRFWVGPVCRVAHRLRHRVHALHRERGR